MFIKHVYQDHSETIQSSIDTESHYERVSGALKKGHYLNKCLLNSHKHLHISVHSGWVLEIKPPPEKNRTGGKHSINVLD